MKPTIIITAANGFIGKTLVRYLSRDYRIIALVRKPQASCRGVKFLIWDGMTVGAWSYEFEGALAVINLAGKSVNCRYTEENKAAIFASRLESTNAIGEAINRCAHKPKVWINAASATIYAHSERIPNTEATGMIGTGFSVDVCQQWEACFNSFAQPGLRQIVLRTAIVLGKDGGVMVPFKRLARFGLGGSMGSGKQQLSWVHEEDVCRAIAFFIQQEATEGVYNISAPNPVTNERFMHALRKRLRIPFGIPQPKWLLELGARLIGTETELIFKSRFVLPERLLQAGFVFKHGTIEECLKAL
jgi:hypothetical protein